MIAVRDIEKLKTRNIGGLARVQLIFEKDIYSMPEHTPASLTLQGDMVLYPGKRAYNIYFTKKTSSFKEDTVINNAAGDYSNQLIRFKTPKDRPVLRHLVHRCSDNRVCIVYRDRNGYFKIVRNLRVKVSTGTGTFQSYNGTTFQLIGKSKQATGFWNYVPNVYLDPPDGPIIHDDDDTRDNEPGDYVDTNWANTDLTFLENRIHNLEDKVLALIGSGQMIIGGTNGDSKLTVLGGDIEVGEMGFGFILRDDQNNRWRVGITHQGVWNVCKL